jgi:hypothetical protein
MPALRPSFHLTPCSKFHSHLYYTRDIAVDVTGRQNGDGKKTS